MVEDITKIKVEGGTVYTKTVGSGSKKILLLHGGPGLTHECFENFSEQLKEQDVQLIYYDQLGSFFSDQPEDVSLFNMARYVEEVKTVVDTLKLQDFYILGHSWGGALLMEYALKYPDGLKGMIISNMMADFDAYEVYVQHLFSKFPAEIQTQFTELIKQQKFAEPEFQQLVFQYWYAPHMCKLDPWPEPMLRTLQHLAAPVLMTILGPNPFEVLGTLKHWNRFNDLKKITVPTLVIGATYDSMDPALLRSMANELPNGSYAHCPNGSHFSMWDDTANYFNAIKGFLKER